MRHLYCKECGKKYPETIHQKLLFPRSSCGEPAEFGRIVKGIAKQPQASQRVIYMNDSPFPLDHHHYDCDGCGTAIMPGEEATCLSVWNERQQVIPEWEHEFLEVRR